MQILSVVAPLAALAGVLASPATELAERQVACPDYIVCCPIFGTASSSNIAPLLASNAIAASPDAIIGIGCLPFLPATDATAEPDLEICHGPLCCKKTFTFPNGTVIGIDCTETIIIEQ
ncbi:hypothetical protein SCHPADRAFT_939358 [Schizopora paradoxa]|uniref:Hydrophobin n=1 Tax=Schizopora paradoxa TaxID=27342 RepID=A0A0H2RSU1_9AGAM|nr:hypothetical protein SCHPADRAFT_939358 [Schizopora paradoxa]